MPTRSAAIASEVIAEQTASDFLAQGGSATGAVLAGFFAAAGAHAGVLLGPVSILLGAVGTGVRAFDGRLRQPGRGGRRPRGFRSSEAIPTAARVAVPAGVAAALVALAYDGSQRLGGMVKAGVRLAERGGAESRAELLLRIRAVGAAALGETEFVRAMLREAGPSQGGLLTSADFKISTDLEQRASQRQVGDMLLHEPPWAADLKPLAPGSECGVGGAVCAVDVQGGFATLAYRRVLDGFAIDAYELVAPLVAVPVERGVERIRPGTCLPSPTPLAIRCDAASVPLEVMASPAAHRIDADTLAGPILRLRRDPQRGWVEVVR